MPCVRNVFLLSHTANLCDWNPGNTFLTTYCFSVVELGTFCRRVHFFFCLFWYLSPTSSRIFLGLVLPSQLWLSQYVILICRFCFHLRYLTANLVPTKIRPKCSKS